MIQALSLQQSVWVDKTLDSLSIEQCIAQLLNVVRPEASTDDWLRLIEKTPIGCMTVRNAPAEAHQTLIAAIQNHSPIPLLVAANMEHGATELEEHGTEFPWPMAAGAANSETLSAVMGQAIGIEARHIGINWAYNPVVDLNYNFDNPITNIRSMGDNPDRVSRLAPALIQAMQQHGVAATAKHFPGDGMDDRDQHLVTTVNTLPFDQWRTTYGRVWQAVFEAGVMCIMPGHISLPDYQGFADRPVEAPPATISSKLLIDLLRHDLGFEGLVISDASPMVGLTSRVDPEERIIRSIQAGIDVYLFSDPDLDFKRLMRAISDGRLSEERIRQSTRRVLETKARLNLLDNPFGPEPTAGQKADFQQAAQSMADRSITILRHTDQQPLSLPPAAKVLTVTIAQLNPMMGQTDLETFDEELRKRGFDVSHMLNPKSDELLNLAQSHQAVFVNIYLTPIMTLGNLRVTDSFFSWGWRSLFKEHQQVVYTAFGSPYVVYELPQVPNLIATYGGSDVSQRAALKVWLGELEPQGTLPVKLPEVRVAPLPAD